MPMADMNAVPLVDVMLVLLVIFIVTVLFVAATAGCGNLPQFDPVVAD